MSQPTDLFGNPEPIPLPTKRDKRGRKLPKPKPKTNPLIPVYGPGPDGTKCGGCVHHFFKSYAKNYPKCGIRPDGAAATDHSSRYASCGKFEPKPGK